jgi:hypothetical protein
MRRYVTFVLLLALPALFLFLRSRREVTPHQVTTAPATKAAREKSGKRAAGSGDRRPSAGAKRSPVAGDRKRSRSEEPSARPAEAPTSQPAKHEPPLARPLRVVGLGWELLAPAVTANAGITAGKASLFTADRLKVKLRAFATSAEIEAALARGGDDKLGADIAVLPLATFAALYERLRALAPDIFFVTGWSRGRHGLMARPRVSLARPPRGNIDLLGRADSPATFFALSLLDLSGIALRRVRLLDPSGDTASDERKNVRLRYIGNPSDSGKPFVYSIVEPTDKRVARAPFAAVSRPLPASAQKHGRRFVATTADAGRLIPMVAIAPRAFAAEHGEALSIFVRGWLAGARRLQRDVPKVARQIASDKDTPHALDLIQRLGQIEGATLRDNASLFALSGRSAATLDALFRDSWRVWRDAGVLASPAPDASPIAPTTVAALVRDTPTLIDEARRTSSAVEGRKPAGGSTVVERLLLHRLSVRRWNEETRQRVIDQVGFVGTVFDQAIVRLHVRGNGARNLVERVLQRFEFARPSRVTLTQRRSGPLAAIELLVRR